MGWDIKAAVARLRSREIADRFLNTYASEQAVRQFNALLAEAQGRFSMAIDLQALAQFQVVSTVPTQRLEDSIERLAEALTDVGDVPSGPGPMLDQKFGILRAERQLDKDFADYQSDHAGLGLLFFDIDHFKALNGRYTETIVDRDLLSPFHRYLTDVVDVRGFAYSVGGDEFVILLRNVDASESLAFASRLLRMTTERSFIVEGETRTITLSVGVAAYPSDASTLSGLRELANRAEHKAKEDGRARVCSAGTLANAALLDSPMQPA